MNISMTRLFILVASLVVGNMAAAGPAARQTDSTSHGGIVTNGEPTVRIGGLPAARLNDLASCPLVDQIGLALFPHVGGNITTASTTVRIGGLPAARMGDLILEIGATAPVSYIVTGSPTVLIGD